jgi:hypothetical protein
MTPPNVEALKHLAKKLNLLEDRVMHLEDDIKRNMMLRKQTYKTRELIIKKIKKIEITLGLVKTKSTQDGKGKKRKKGRTRKKRMKRRYKKNRTKKKSRKRS